MAQAPKKVNHVTVRGVTYEVEDSTARAAVADVSNKVSKTGDTMSGKLTVNVSSGKSIETNKGVVVGSGGVEVTSGGVTVTAGGVNVNGGNVNLASGQEIILNRSASTGELLTGDNTVLLRTGTDSNNWRGVRAKANSLDLEYATSTGGTAKDYDIDYCRYTTFSSSPLTAENRHEYRYNGSSALSALTIKWPEVDRGTIFSVVFSSGSSFSGITHKKYDNNNLSPKMVGDTPNQANRVYDLVCWYDGYYWCAVKSAEA